jgi:hypothetical protein
MLDELLVIVSAELILLASIAAMSRRGRRIDVLSGRYFGHLTERAVSRDGIIDRLRRWVERERKVQQLRKAKASTSNAGTLRPSANAQSGSDDGDNLTKSTLAQSNCPRFS